MVLPPARSPYETSTNRRACGLGLLRACGWRAACSCVSICGDWCRFRAAGRGLFAPRPAGVCGLAGRGRAARGRTKKKSPFSTSRKRGGPSFGQKFHFGAAFRCRRAARGPLFMCKRPAAIRKTPDGGFLWITIFESGRPPAFAKVEFLTTALRQSGILDQNRGPSVSTASDRADLPPARGGVLVKTCFHWREESRKTVLRGQNRRSLEANRTVWPGNTPRRPPGRFGFPTKPLIIGTRLDAWSKPAFSVPTAKAGFDHGGRLPVSGAIDRTDLPDARGFGSGISSPQPAGAYPRERAGLHPYFPVRVQELRSGTEMGRPGSGRRGPRAPKSPARMGCTGVSPAHGLAVEAAPEPEAAHPFPDRVF